MSYIFNPLQSEGFIPVVEQASSRGLGYEHPPNALPPIDPRKGDRWTEITEEGDWVQSWFWNSTINRWLSVQEHKMEAKDASINNNAAKGLGGHSHTVDADLFFIKTMYTYYPVGGGTLDVNNYWNFNLKFISTIEETSFTNIQTPPGSDFVQAKITTLVNTLLITTENDYLFYRFAHTPTGTPSNLINVFASAIYRLARK